PRRQLREQREQDVVVRGVVGEDRRPRSPRELQKGARLVVCDRLRRGSVDQQPEDGRAESDGRRPGAASDRLAEVIGLHVTGRWERTRRPCDELMAQPPLPFWTCASTRRASLR